MNREVTGDRSPLLTIMLIAWASPASVVGLFLGTMGLVSGGKCRRKGHTIEFWGGWVSSILRSVPIEGGALAMTLGHVILGATEAGLDITRDHEMVHVAQYEQWGPFFIPAYGIMSAGLWLLGRDPYRDNPFEKEAFDKTRRPGNML